MAFDKAEVVVIGAGVSGLSTAWWLAKAGVDVLVIEKGVIAMRPRAATAAWSALAASLS